MVVCGTLCGGRKVGVRMFPTSRVGLVLVAWLVFALPASATTMVKLDVPALAKAADLIVRGKVAKVESRWSGDHRTIFTETQLEVVETLKGAATKTVVVRQPGGEVGDIGQRVSGVARFSSGEEVVVFLESRPGNFYLVSGMSQGKFSVERSTDGKSAFVVPQSEDGALLLDPVTRLPAAGFSAPVELQVFRKTVLAATAASPAPPASSPQVPAPPEPAIGGTVK